LAFRNVNLHALLITFSPFFLKKKYKNIRLAKEIFVTDGASEEEKEVIERRDTLVIKCCIN
jgi:hypothetical protein